MRKHGLKALHRKRLVETAIAFKPLPDIPLFFKYTYLPKSAYTKWTVFPW